MSSDLLLDVAQNKQARKIIESLGLPIPLPVRLRRDRSPWTAAPLHDRAVLVGAFGDGALLGTIASTLAGAGADAYVEGASLVPFAEPGETFGRPAKAAASFKEGARFDALVFDAAGITRVEQLRALYDFFHPYVTRMQKSARIVVIGRANDGASPELAAAIAALEGFVRSVAKEVGRHGSTANLVLVESGAEARLTGVLRFVLSSKSAFLSAQPLVVSNKAKGGKEPSYVRPLEKKVVIVTGAARGIGEATARLLAQEGAHVICLDRPADDGPTSKLARDIGGTALLVDIGAADAASQIEEAIKPFGGVDVIVHNAGITRDKTLGRMKPELWDSVLDVNLAAVIRITTALEKQIKDGGRVICLSSVAGIGGNPGQTNYAASKAGIMGYVKALSAKLADRGITVNAIAPGFIETRMTAAIPLAIREGARRMAALGQGGQPEDIGQGIVFFASPGSQGITGRTLRFCGGALIGA